MLNPKERPPGTALYTQKCPKSLTNKFFFLDFFSFPAPYYQTFRRHLGQCASCVTPPPSPIHIPQVLRHLLYDLNQTILYLLCIYLFIYLSLQNWFGTAFSATRCLYLCIFCYHLPLFFFLFHVRKIIKQKLSNNILSNFTRLTFKQKCWGRTCATYFK